MTINIGQIFVEFVADTARFRDDVSKVGTTLKLSADQMKTSLGEVSEAVEAAKTVFEGYIAALGVEKIAEFITATTEAAQQLRTAAEVAGLSTTAYQELTLAGEHVGITHEQMTSGLDKFTKSVGLAADGNKKTAEAFKELGVSVLYADGTIRPTEDIFNQVAGAIAGIASPAERAREEVVLFGRAGMDMAPLLNQGADGVTALRAEVEKLGLVMSAETIQKLANVQVQIDELTQHWRVFTAHLVELATPALIGFIDTLNNLITTTTEHASRTAIETRQADLLSRAIKDQTSVLAEDLKKANDPGWMQSLQFWKDWPAIIAGDRAELKKLQDQYDSLGVTMDRFAGASLHPMHGGHATTGAPVETAAGSGTTKETQAQKDAKAYEAVVAALNAEIAALQGDSEATKLSTELKAAHAKAGSLEADMITSLVGKVDELTKAKKARAEADKALAKEQTDAINLLNQLSPATEKFTDDEIKLAEYLNEHVITLEQYTTAMAALKKQMDAADPTTKAAAEQQKAFKSETDALASSLGTDLARAFTDAGTAADRFRNLATHVLQDVLNAVVKLLETALTKGGSGGLSGIFDAIGSALFGAAAGGAGTSQIVGHAAVAGFAGGGHMNFGDLAIVGEEGPELWAPDVPGSVIPADVAAGMGGGGNTAYIDARGADPAAIQRLEAGLRQLHYSVEPRAIAAVSGERKRGGAFASYFGR